MDNFTGYIATGLVSLVVGLLLQRFQARPRLLYWFPGTFLFELKEENNINLRTDSLTVQNFGRKPAANIEIIHKTKPDHFQFSTPVSFIEENSPSGEHLIKIPSLGPKEHINIQLLSHKAPPVLLNIRSDEGPAKLIQVHFQRLLPKSVQALAGITLLIGLGFVLYWLVAAIIFLSKSIGVA